MTDITKDILYDALKKSGTDFTDVLGPLVKKVNNSEVVNYQDTNKSSIEHTDLFGSSAEKADNREVVDHQDVNKLFNDPAKFLGPSEEEAKTMKKINLYKDMNELGAEVTQFGQLFATLRIKEDVILFTSSTGEHVSAYGIRKYYQENIYQRTEPKSMVYHENIHNNGSTYANYVEIIGHTSGWDVEMLMVEVCLDQNTQYMILVY